MRRSVLSALVVYTLLGVWSVALAQDASNKAKEGKKAESSKVETEAAETVKPVVVVSFAGMDQAMKAVKTIDKLGDGTLAGKLEGAIEKLVCGRAIPGLDPKRPWGLVVLGDGQQFPVVAFLPVTDLKKLLAALEPFVGKAKEASKDVLEVNVRNQSLFIAQRDGWAFVAPTVEHLENIPKDPAKTLDGLNDSFDVAVRVLVKNVPMPFRQMLIGLLQVGMQRGAERQPGESDDQYALRSKLVKQTMQQLTTLLNELDSLQLGVKVDEKSASAKIEYQLAAIPGTKTAKQMSGDSQLQGKFAGLLLPDAAFALQLAAKLEDADVARAKSMLTSTRAQVLKELEKQELSEADKKQATQILGDLFDVAQKSLETGRLDGGLAVIANRQVLTFVVGAAAADTAKLDAVVKQLVPHLRKEIPELGEKIKLNAETYEGVTLHTMAMPTNSLGDAGPKLAEMVGENLDLVIGIGPDRVYLAAGRNAASTLRQAIANTKAVAGKATPPLQFSVATAPIAKAVAAHGRRDAVRQSAGKMAKTLEQLPGKDHITAIQVPVANGQKVQIVIESGVLKVIALLPTLGPDK